jgi:hypothetical protein
MREEFALMSTLVFDDDLDRQFTCIPEIQDQIEAVALFDGVADSGQPYVFSPSGK